MSITDAFFCVLCGVAIDPKHRLSTRYCGRKCRNKATNLQRREETLAQRSAAEEIQGRHALWLKHFQLELLRHAPPEAGGYQAGLWTGREVCWFPWLPREARYRNTLLRTRSRYRFFPLHPFEPPSVPLETFYRIRYVQAVPPHPELPASIVPEWLISIPFAVRIHGLPFSLKSIGRTIRG